MLDVVSVLNVLDVLRVLRVLNVLDVLKDAIVPLGLVCCISVPITRSHDLHDVKM